VLLQLDDDDLDGFAGLVHLTDAIFAYSLLLDGLWTPMTGT
jgi:hypothetical protein